MATSAQRSRKKTSTARKTGGSRSAAGKKQAVIAARQSAITNEIILIGVFALTVLLFLCNFGVIGVVGDAISGVLFGIFGLTAYAVPLLAFVAIAFGISNQGNRVALMKLIAGIVLFLLIGIICELAVGDQALREPYSILKFYETSAQERMGGGILGGSLAWLCHYFLGIVGTVLLIIVFTIICLVIITEKSFVSGVKTSGRYVYETARTDALQRRERSEVRREEMRVRREEMAQRNESRKQEAAARAQARQLLKEKQQEEEKARQDAQQILRMDKKVSGVMMDTSLKEADRNLAIREDMHEITLDSIPEETVEIRKATPMGETEEAFDNIRIRTMHQTSLDETEGFVYPTEAPASVKEEALFVEEAPEEAAAYIEPEAGDVFARRSADVFRDMKEVSLPVRSAQSKPIPQEQVVQEVPFCEEEPVTEAALPSAAAHTAASQRPKAAAPKAPQSAAEATPLGQQMAKQEKQQPKLPEKPYRFPPISLLHKSNPKNSGDSVRELKETALHLQETLETFGVRVTITDISQGPTVTRYELQPEQGVKVSKILGLQDDIKLNLAATDIRIEAPIPGKAAVGIEVPNKENTAVGLRELLETKEFKDFPSRIAFAVGKDIGGKVIVSDIAKMPHMLIAGSTGSGKSVCINTLIMSILYKADPKDVKLILVDPKVVELSVYNGIPHLLIPVVTDPKKASAALQWGVAEMSDRYRRFADYNVRDLKGYNQKVEQMKENGETDIPEKMPQIVIIVDELADLMMVAPGEVEESICRLAQLARAAGIHLIIATQRPSVDVITGLIKANMPSRVAFAVSSGTDSRTILDMNGAEKLLGKGDMLFYPQGYSKPIRVQGAFVSDGEVSDVVDFLKNQKLGNAYGEDIEEKLRNMSTASGGGAGDGAQTEYDSYFVDAGKFIIDKDKASIGMLQRFFRIGFNRAARIMDQLAEVGVVGEEEGTKPRKILMTMDEFEQLVEEII